MWPHRCQKEGQDHTLGLPGNTCSGSSGWCWPSCCKATVLHHGQLVVHQDPQPFWEGCFPAGWPPAYIGIWHSAFASVKLCEGHFSSLSRCHWIGVLRSSKISFLICWWTSPVFLFLKKGFINTLELYSFIRYQTASAGLFPNNSFTHWQTY